MNIRKHWKKILLSSTAFFWASCGGDSESVYATGGNNNEDPVALAPDSAIGDIGTVALYGVQAVVDLDSGAVSSSDACDGDCTVPASSEDATVSSSSEALSSSSDGTKTFKLASDPNATCKMTGSIPTGSCIEFAQSTSTRSSKPTQQDLKNQLQNNKTKTLEELEEIEDELEDTPDFSEVALYGVQMPSCRRYNFQETFECSNGSTYTTYADNSGMHILKDSTIYSREEYNQKYSSSSKAVKSSSSAEPLSSSSAEPPSPLCTKSDFANVDDLSEQFKSDKAAIIDSVKQTADTTAKACLDAIPNREFLASIQGLVAKKQICDGDTIVNPRYQAKLDSNKAKIQRKIDNCLKDPE